MKGPSWLLTLHYHCNEKDSLAMLSIINRFRQDENGATMVEYGLMVALVALVAAIGAQLMGNDLSILFSSVGSYIKAVPVPTAP
jgi:pilus assembly protein Flp/PilA